jgi:hypothetical protein
MERKRIVCIGLTWLLGVGIAYAADAPSKQAIELVHLVQSKEVYSKSIDQTYEQMAASMPQLTPDMRQKLRQVVEECLPYEEVVAWSASVYDKHFNPAELGDLIAFYQTPTGKKVARTMPELAGEVGRKMGEVFQERMPAAMKKHGVIPQDG